MLRKMYLVPAEKYSEAPKRHSPPISEAPRHTRSLSPQPPQKKKKKKKKKSKKTKKKKAKKQKRHPYEKWVKYRKKMREDEIRRMTQMHAIADFLQKDLPVPPMTLPPSAIAKAPPPPTTRRLDFGTQTTPEKERKQTVPPPQPSTSMAETFASTPKSSFAEISDDDGDDDNVFVEDDAQAFGRENVGPIASPYIVPYLYNRRYLDTQYGLRKDGD